MRNIKVGMLVKISRKVEVEVGWDNEWVSEMDDFIGKQGYVAEVSTFGVDVIAIPYRYPPSALEVIPQTASEGT